MDSYHPRFTEQAKVVIRQAIAEQPRSMDELKSIARINNIPFAARAVHEAAWEMIDDEEVFWNDFWCLQLITEDSQKRPKEGYPFWFM